MNTESISPIRRPDHSPEPKPPPDQGLIREGEISNNESPPPVGAVAVAVEQFSAVRRLRDRVVLVRVAIVLLNRATAGVQKLALFVSSFVHPPESTLLAFQRMQLANIALVPISFAAMGITIYDILAHRHSVLQGLLSMLQQLNQAMSGVSAVLSIIPQHATAGVTAATSALGIVGCFFSVGWLLLQGMQFFQSHKFKEEISTVESIGDLLKKLQDQPLEAKKEEEAPKELWGRVKAKCASLRDSWIEGFQKHAVQYRAMRHLRLKEERINVLCEALKNLPDEHKLAKLESVKKHLVTLVRLKQGLNALSMTATLVSIAIFPLIFFGVVAAPIAAAIVGITIIGGITLGFYIAYKQRQVVKELEAELGIVSEENSSSRQGFASIFGFAASSSPEPDDMMGVAGA